MICCLKIYNPHSPPMPKFTIRNKRRPPMPKLTIRNMREVLEPIPDSKVNGATMGPTCVLSPPDGPHVGPMNLAIRESILFTDRQYDNYKGTTKTKLEKKTPHICPPSVRYGASVTFAVEHPYDMNEYWVPRTPDNFTGESWLYLTLDTICHLISIGYPICGDKTIIRLSYLHNGNSYTSKTAPWISPPTPPTHNRLTLGNVAMNFYHYL